MDLTVMHINKGNAHGTQGERSNPDNSQHTRLLVIKVWDANQRSNALHDLQAGKTAGILLQNHLWKPWKDEFLSSCSSFLIISQNRLICHTRSDRALQPTITWIQPVFFIRTSNFEVEAYRSYDFCYLRLKTFFRSVFLDLPGILYNAWLLQTEKCVMIAIRKPLLMLYKTCP